mmetsp:Transcript_6042/g.14760  ORF Transcript_6042/g.14760 Transcript_6042/m.14760 type:complete len:213 (-) Transcript_6042:72-710(-)
MRSGSSGTLRAGSCAWCQPRMTELQGAAARWTTWARECCRKDAPSSRTHAVSPLWHSRRAENGLPPAAGTPTSSCGTLIQGRRNAACRETSLPGRHGACPSRRTGSGWRAGRRVGPFGCGTQPRGPCSSRCQQHTIISSRTSTSAPPKTACSRAGAATARSVCGTLSAARSCEALRGGGSRRFRPTGLRYSRRPPRRQTTCSWSTRSRESCA